MNNSKITKKQHIIPQFYLNGFSENGKINVYDIKRKKEYKCSIRDTCEENLTYEFTKDKSHIPGNEIETLLATKCEPIWAEIFKKIKNSKGYVVLTPSDCLNLIRFCFIQIMRTNKGRLVVDELWTDMFPNGDLKKNIQNSQNTDLNKYNIPNVKLYCVINGMIADNKTQFIVDKCDFYKSQIELCASDNPVFLEKNQEKNCYNFYFPISHNIYCVLQMGRKRCVLEGNWKGIKSEFKAFEPLNLNQFSILIQGGSNKIFKQNEFTQSEINEINEINAIIKIQEGKNKAKDM